MSIIKIVCKRVEELRIHLIRTEVIIETLASSAFNATDGKQEKRFLEELEEQKLIRSELLTAWKHCVEYAQEKVK